ncbi:hypothetical protein B0H11DRAFT_2209351 [Mycena galericulata]|nr:hypothetical protein B0H11DRAFT_2209351 [Mycena galericulata]
MAFTSSQHPAERPQILRQDLQGASAIPDGLHRRSLGASALSMTCLVPHVLRSPAGRFYMSSILFQRRLYKRALTSLASINTHPRPTEVPGYVFPMTASCLHTFDVLVGLSGRRWRRRVPE